RPVLQRGPSVLVDSAPTERDYPGAALCSCRSRLEAERHSWPARRRHTGPASERDFHLRESGFQSSWDVELVRFLTAEWNHAGGSAGVSYSGYGIRSADRS